MLSPVPNRSERNEAILLWLVMKTIGPDPDVPDPADCTVQRLELAASLDAVRHGWMGVSRQGWGGVQTARDEPGDVARGWQDVLRCTLRASGVTTFTTWT